MTKLLAIETTDIRGSVACAQGETILLRHELNPEQRSAQSLVPAIDALLKEVGWSPSHLDEIAVAVGPGSFTGLRVGVTTAKILAWSVNARLYGIDTLAAIASKIVTERETILPEIRRNPIFPPILLIRGVNQSFPSG